ncbi:transposase [Streptomyces sp. NBC_01589]|uniref:transposase n=1 Tax=unclassified Streptomyces TaxID=2593676 RepID=UPI00386852B0
MTAPDSLPFAALLEENLASASPDLLRQMVKTFADAMMSADVDNACGAAYGMPSEERVNSRPRPPVQRPPTDHGWGPLTSSFDINRGGVDGHAIRLCR